MLIEVEEGGGAELKENGIRKELVREEWEANALIIVKTSKNKLEDMQCEVKVHLTPTFRLSHAYSFPCLTRIHSVFSNYCINLHNR